MGLKSYTLRLDEEIYEGLKKEFENLGDPDLNMSFVIRKYLRDLYGAIPNLKKSDMGLMNNLAFWGMMLKQMSRTAQIENLLSGELKIERALETERDKKSVKGKGKKKLKHA